MGVYAIVTYDILPAIYDIRLTAHEKYHRLMFRLRLLIRYYRIPGFIQSGWRNLEQDT